MIDARSYRSPNFPFTASQWQELEQQALVFRYLVSGVPVPPDLISTVIRTPFASTCSSSSRLFPQQQTLPIGWGCFQVGYGRKVDPEPGRCRRTDGKKWRCSKEAYPDSKYCERHMHRGKGKAKKQLEDLNNTQNINIKTATKTLPLSPPSPMKRACFPTPATSSSVSSSHGTNYALHKTPSQSYQANSLYPFLSPHSPASSYKQPSDSSISTQNHNAPLWLLDPELYYDQPNRDIRYLHEMKGGLGEKIIGSETSRIKMSSASSGFSDSNLAFQNCRENTPREHKEESFSVDKQDDQTETKAFHYFLGDEPMKSTGWLDFDHSSNRSYKLSTPVSSQTSYYKSNALIHRGG